MKNLSILFFSAALTLATFSTITYTSCKKDKCKDIVCRNGGTCADGTCACPSGFEGANCETKSLLKYEGHYYSDETCRTWNSQANAVIVTMDANDPTILRLSEFGYAATSCNDSFMPVTVSGSSLTVDAISCGYVVKGTGTISTINDTTVLTLNYSMTYPTISGTTDFSPCTIVLKKYY